MYLPVVARSFTRVFVKVQHVNSKGPNEPQWNCYNYSLPDLAKMPVQFCSPEPCANLRKKKKSHSWPEIPQCSNLTWFPENLAP